MTGLVFKSQHLVDEKPEYFLNKKKLNFVQNKTGIMQNTLNMQ